MERHELNIPTIYSHSNFIDADGKQMMPNKSHLDYFWAIIYLYKTKLLSIKENGLSKFKTQDNKTYHQINPNTKWDDTAIVIEFYEIHMLFNDKVNSNYTKLREFITLFENLQIETNIFGKDPSGSKTVKPVKQIKTISNDLELEIILTDEFIRPLLVTSSYFKKVVLNFLFQLPTSKSKTLYLIFKDYDNFHKNFTKKEIEYVVGNIFGNGRISNILNHINSTTDIIVGGDRLKMKKVAYKYTIKSQKRYVSYEEELEITTKKLIRKKAEYKTQKAVEAGTEMKNEEAYMRKIFGQLINDQDEYDKYETMATIDIFLKEKQKELGEQIPDDCQGYSYVAIKLEIDGEIKLYVVNDDYLLREAIFPATITKNPEQTYDQIQNKIGYQIYYCKNEIKDSTKSLLK